MLPGSLELPHDLGLGQSLFLLGYGSMVAVSGLEPAFRGYEPREVTTTSLLRYRGRDSNPQKLEPKSSACACFATPAKLIDFLR